MRSTANNGREVPAAAAFGLPKDFANQPVIRGPEVISAGHAHSYFNLDTLKLAL